MELTCSQLFPAISSGKPWGRGPNGSASGPPNQALLQLAWLQLQWFAPILLVHLQRGTGVSAVIMEMAISFLATASYPLAFTRLVELALWAEHPTDPNHTTYLVRISLIVQLPVGFRRGRMWLHSHSIASHADLATSIFLTLGCFPAPCRQSRCFSSTRRICSMCPPATWAQRWQRCVCLPCMRQICFTPTRSNFARARLSGFSRCEVVGEGGHT